MGHREWMWWCMSNTTRSNNWHGMLNRTSDLINEFLSSFEGLEMSLIIRIIIPFSVRILVLWRTLLLEALVGMPWPFRLRISYLLPALLPWAVFLFNSSSMYLFPTSLALEVFVHLWSRENLLQMNHVLLFHLELRSVQELLHHQED